MVDLDTAALKKGFVKVETCNDEREERVAPIFVVGVWRSGTTLLYALLNQHPDIRLFYESDLPVLWPMFRTPWTRRVWFEKWEYWNAGVSRHNLNQIRLAPQATSLAGTMEWAGRTYAAEAGKKLWGCKSPSYYDRLADLAREFPHARFVVIWRDPEEICDSVIRASSSGHWFARPGTTHKALLASRMLKHQCDRIRSKGASLYQIHYRDLVKDTSNTMRGLCEFLQIPFRSSVTVLDNADRSAVFKGAHHRLALGNRIVAQKQCNESLTPALRSKIQRYKALWKAEFGDDWVLSRNFSGIGPKPGIGERVTDRIWFGILRLWDTAPRFVFSILPTSVWQTYRRIKYKDPLWLHRQLTDKTNALRG